jgi:predicted TIM-barrel fold metal-dependent hydrolase
MGDVGKTDRPYVIISADCHAGPPIIGFREYLDSKYHADFDIYNDHVQKWFERLFQGRMLAGLRQQAGQDDDNDAEDMDAAAGGRRGTVEEGLTGYHQPSVRLKELEQDGIVAEVMYPTSVSAGIPFFPGIPMDLGFPEPSIEEQIAGVRAHNRWMAEFCSEHPDRQQGIGVICNRDLDSAVSEVEWLAAQGVHSVLLPVQVPSVRVPAFMDPAWDRFWAACDANRMVLQSHPGAAGVPRLPMLPGAAPLQKYEGQMIGLRRPLTHLIFGGIFERHPDLTLVFAEQGSAWIPPTLKELDELYASYTDPAFRAAVPKKPSEYWAQNCYVCATFMHPQEAKVRYEIGLDRLMWGSDYPHGEGTWPNSKEALQNAFWDLPEGELRQILTDNPARCYGFDVSKLEGLGAMHGPRPSDLDHPLEQVPRNSSPTFRDKPLGF